MFVLGEPKYYCRFGFDPALARNFTSPYAGRYFMALALNSELPAIEGNIVHAPAFAAFQLGDFIRIDRKDNVLTFTKEAEGALVPVLLEKYGEMNSGSQLAAKAGRGAGKSPRDFGGIAPLLDRGSK